MEGGTGKGAIFLCQIFIRVNPVHLWFKNSSTTDTHGCTQMESRKPFSAQPRCGYLGKKPRIPKEEWHSMGFPLNSITDLSPRASAFLRGFRVRLLSEAFGPLVLTSLGKISHRQGGQL